MSSSKNVPRRSTGSPQRSRHFLVTQPFCSPRLCMVRKPELQVSPPLRAKTSGELVVKEFWQPQKCCFSLIFP